MSAPRTLPVFVTGNQHKAAYLERQLGVRLRHVTLELDELQSTDLHAIVAHKLKQAYAIVRQPVLVEDVSLSYAALNGLPGPLIKWFIDIAGAETCCRMLDGFSDRSAAIYTCFGYYDGRQMRYFDSACAGSISSNPRGENGFGFDTFFIMEGDQRTRAEMPQTELEHTYAEQMKPFAALREFFAAEQQNEIST